MITNVLPPFLWFTVYICEKLAVTLKVTQEVTKTSHHHVASMLILVVVCIAGSR